jgi:predicted MFS family arabinose efflux permease
MANSTTIATAAELAALPKPQNASVQPSFGRGYIIYAVGLMTLVNVLNYMDRQLMAILLEPIKRDFGLSDSQAGLLTGLAFSLLYTALALPAARLADRHSRRLLLSIAVATWSLATGLCGVAGSFSVLLIARLGVGVGEAGVLPTMHSMISDMLPPRRRAIAMSALGVGATTGAMIGVGLGGWVAQNHGWRTAFYAAMFPGLLISLVVFLTLRNPPRGFSDGVQHDGPAPKLGEAVGALLRRPAYRNIIIGIALGAVGMMGSAAWSGPFYMRVHGLTPAEVGAWFTFAHGISGFAGVLLGGALADWLHKYDDRAHVWVVSLSLGMAGVLSAVTYSVADARLSLIMYCLTAAFMAMWMGPLMAAQQGLSGVRYRAIGSATQMIGFNLIGTAGGPLLIGALSDALAPRFGIEALRYAMLLVLPFFFVGLLFMLMALRTMRADMADAAR